jgi:hypothetical protein
MALNRLDTHLLSRNPLATAHLTIGRGRRERLVEWTNVLRFGSNKRPIIWHVLEPITREHVSEYDGVGLLSPDFRMLSEADVGRKLIVAVCSTYTENWVSCRVE